jgi:hypothetical protein
MADDKLVLYLFLPKECSSHPTSLSFSYPGSNVIYESEFTTAYVLACYGLFDKKRKGM